MSDVFISYARSSTAAQAKAVAGALRTVGYDVWLDDELPAHRGFTGVIEEQLRAAKAVIVIWSAEAAKSDWVQSEANRGREDHKLVQVNVDNTKLPIPFDRIHCADMSGWNGDTQTPGWKKVIASIADLTGGPGTSTVQATKPTVRKNSICVLPFVNMSGDTEQEYFSDGISEDIITDLSKVSALFVIARNTAFTFKAKSVDVSHVARQLNISHVLEGSVRKAGGRVRITAQLIDGATGGHIWAERYDRVLTDIFALQDEIAEAIVKALKLKLLPEEKQQIGRRGTSNLEAYDLYLRGTRPGFGPESLLARITLLEAATRLAPDYADAWGELAFTRDYWRITRPYAEWDEINVAVTAEAERALALEPDHTAALAAQLSMLPPFGRFVEAEALVIRLEKNVSSWQYGGMYSGHHLGSVGRKREAIERVRRAYEIDPLNPNICTMLSGALRMGGRYAEARQIDEDTLVRWPDNHFAAANLIVVCVHTQDWVRVDALLAPERLTQFPLRQFEAGLRGLVSLMRNPSPQSRRGVIEAARTQFDAAGHADLGQLQLAAHFGDLDEAHAIAAQARFGPTGSYPTNVLFDAMPSEFRRDPRFVKLCARLGLVDYWLTTQHWPDCVDEVAPYYDFKAECEKVAAGPPLPPANEAGWL